MSFAAETEGLEVYHQFCFVIVLLFERWVQSWSKRWFQKAASLYVSRELNEPLVKVLNLASRAMP